AVSLNLKRGLALPCYCFGGSGAIISASTLIRLALLGLGEILLLRPYQPVFPLAMALPGLAFGLFWSSFTLVICLWLFGLRDVIRLVRTFDKELPSTQRI